MRASTAPSPTWRFRIDAVPHTVLGTHAGTISRQSRRSSTWRLRVRTCATLPSARLFLCAGCRAQSCDLQLLRSRPNLLCRRLRRSEPGTARSVLPDGATRPAVGGGSRHADRARRYRARCKKVTHHGSPAPPPDDLLPPGSPAIASDAASRRTGPGDAASHCHWCGRRCPASRPPGVPAPPPPSSRPACDTTGQDQTMVTPPDIEAQILRYYHAEKWRVGTIARQLHVHHSVVHAGAGAGRAAQDRRRRRGRRRSTRICRSSARRWRRSRR